MILFTIRSHFGSRTLMMCLFPFRISKASRFHGAARTLCLCMYGGFFLVDGGATDAKLKRNPLARQRSSRTAGKDGKTFNYTFSRILEASPTKKSKATLCNVTKTYIASDWEIQWRMGVDQWADDSPLWEQGCYKLGQQFDNVLAWLSLWDARNIVGLEPPDMKPKFGTIFGYHIVRSDCGATLNIPIEPLVGFLRHPLYHCFKEKKRYQRAKEYMFPVFQKEVVPQPTGSRKGPMAFYFDLGASTYSDGFGGASLKWFVEEYKKRGIMFDRILAWEGAPQDPADLFAGFEVGALDRVSYFNTFVDPEPSAKMNPLRMLQELAVADDFVVFKLDIDQTIVENQFIRQILSDKAISDLIDELFWENHVLRNPMIYQGWKKTPGLGVEQESFAANASWNATHRGVVRSANDITHSYECFHALRERGIRAHSWV